MVDFTTTFSLIHFSFTSRFTILHKQRRFVRVSFLFCIQIKLEHFGIFPKCSFLFPATQFFDWCYTICYAVCYCTLFFVTAFVSKDVREVMKEYCKKEFDIYTQALFDIISSSIFLKNFTCANNEIRFCGNRHSSFDFERIVIYCVMFSIIFYVVCRFLVPIKRINCVFKVFKCSIYFFFLRPYLHNSNKPICILPSERQHDRQIYYYVSIRSTNKKLFRN